jgi:hypothetical protein
MDGRDLHVYRDTVVRFLVEEHGFKVSRRQCIRMDGLTRIVEFSPLFATPDAYRFEVSLDLGIPGLSEPRPVKGDRWLVRANAHLASRAKSVYPKPEFVLRADESGIPTAPGVEVVVRRLSEDFLLRYRDPEDLYRMVCKSALRFSRNPNDTDDEFADLQLDPWNTVPRLELAAVYAAFLGFDEDAGRLLREARDSAEAHRLDFDYAITRMEANVESARRRRIEG